AAAAWVIGKTTLGLRSDYLAIATLGIGEIIVAVMKNEDWLDRGVKNATNIPRPWPVPREVDLQSAAWFSDLCASMGWNPVTASTILVQLLYGALFLSVLLVLLWACELALKSPWGRMMRAIRDNETAARAMGKDVTGRHLQIFILGSAICGLAGAMMISLDGLLTPGGFTPLRYTFTIWLMVIVGGSGNNWGAILGSFLIWFLWIKVDPWGNALMYTLTQGMADGSSVKTFLVESAAQMRTISMGLILLLVLRFAPKGLIPEK
ncbi:MAG: branched-chain amino acid ABC transporter permease, partial [Rhodobacteraceae bacterium]|nr:branched-chain amino acid ABC transporter permease [Paracoccaceae bacterium]